MSYSGNTAIVFLIFNRPELTKRVFERIRAAQPKTLLVVADGPRLTHPEDQETCRLTREIVDSGVDWPCQVMRNFSDVNLGCRNRISSGLSWAFSIVEEVIVLEDDCYPHDSFFPFCEAMLARYRADSRVALISGSNFQDGREHCDESYYFSRYTHIWGWASWRRFWKEYDVDIKEWKNLRDTQFLVEILQSKKIAQIWSELFEGVFQGKTNTWDYQVTFCAWISRQLSIVPKVNLVENIGFGEQATHTKGEDWTPRLFKGGMSFPLTHPTEMLRNANADEFLEKKWLMPSSFCAKILKRIFKFLNPKKRVGANSNAQK